MANGSSSPTARRAASASRAAPCAQASGSPTSRNPASTRWPTCWGSNEEAAQPEAEPMKLGLYIRNMGPQSTRSTLLECARLAEQAAIDHLWVADHVAIPPDQAEGSGGRYLDPLATLAFLAAATTKIGLGTGVLVVPYRPPLATAK